MNFTGRFVVTSVVRRADQLQASGFVRVVDQSTSRILMACPVPESLYRSGDLNPRGGTRGARGIATCNDRIVIANTEKLMVFDSSWYQIGEISHPLLAGIHDILAEDDGIWVTSTVADLLVRCDWNGNLIETWEWRKDANLMREFGFPRLPAVNRSLDFREPAVSRSAARNIVHLNAVSRTTNGLLLSFGRVISPRKYYVQSFTSRLGAVARKLGIQRDGMRNGGTFKTPRSDQPLLAGNRMAGCGSAIVSLRDDGTTQVLTRQRCTEVPNHNACGWLDGLVFNDSNANELVGRDLTTEARDIRVPIPGSPGFLRGLAQFDRHRFLVGNQFPAAIYDVDLSEQRVRGICNLNGERNESVYCICQLPDSFDDPPPSLFSHRAFIS